MTRLGMARWPLWMMVLLASALLTGCSPSFFQAQNNNGTTGSTTTSYVYVAMVTSGGVGGNIAEYSLSAGTLSALSGSPITLQAAPTAMVVAPNNGFVYVGTTIGLFVYTIGSDGTLTEGNNNVAAYVGPAPIQSLAIDPSSSWLLITYKGSSELDALPLVATSGLPTSTVVSVLLSSATPGQITITSEVNNLASVFVTLGVGGTEVIPFNAAGQNPFGSSGNLLNLASGSTAATAVTIDPSSKYAYVAEDGSLGNILRTFTITTLAQTGTSAVLGASPSAVLADESGGYVYAANTGDNTLSGFAASSGSLTELTNAPFATAKSPVALVEDASHTYIMVAGSSTNPNLWVYKFDTASLGTLDVASSISTTSAVPSGVVALGITH